jgi:hypothetical protein
MDYIPYKTFINTFDLDNAPDELKVILTLPSDLWEKIKKDNSIDDYKEQAPSEDTIRIIGDTGMCYEDWFENISDDLYAMYLSHDSFEIDHEARLGV